jgi:hypothetical protein
MPRVTTAPAKPAKTATSSTPTTRAHTGRAKYTSPDQKLALAQCDSVVARLKAVIVEAAAKDPLLKGIKASGITVDTLMDFPSVAVKKNGQLLFDRQDEIAALRKLLPAKLRDVPMGDISPY